MMKKAGRWIAAACVLTLTGAALAACGKKEEAKPEPAAVTETPTPSPEEKIGRLITKANDEKTLIDKYGSLACRVKMHMQDETVESAYVYLGEKYYYSEQGGSFVVDDDGDAYGYIAEEVHPEYRCLFVGDAYEEFREDEHASDWSADYEEDAALAGDADEEGMLTVEVPQKMTEEMKEQIEAQGFTGTKKGSLLSVYTVDETSYEIAEEKCYLVGKDKKKTLLQEVTMLYDEKKPEVEQAYMDRVFSQDFRKVQVIADPGSPKEQTYTQTVGKGCPIQILLPESYDQHLYADATCTGEWQPENADLDSDCVVYALSTEGGHGVSVTPEEGAGEESAPEDVTVEEDTSEEAAEETAQCPTCGRRFAVDESSGTSEFQQHMELEDRLAAAKEHLEDQSPLDVVENEDLAKQCPWCEEWYSTESLDGVTSDYVEHTQWEKEYETVYNSLNQ